MGVQKRAQCWVVVVKGVVHVIGGDARCQRQITAGQRLGQAQEIRSDVGLFAGKHGPGAAEAHGDLVMNQVHAIPVAGLAQQLEVDRVVHAHAACALNQRLDDHRRDAVVMLGQGLLHHREHRAGVLFPAHAFGPVIAVGARHLDGVHQQRFVGFGEEWHVTDCHRCHGLAVVAVGQSDEAFFVRLAAIEPVMKAHFQRDFDAGRTVVSVEAARQPFGRHRHQALGQLDDRLMAEARQNHMLQLIDLILDALIDTRVGVAEYVDPPGADRV